MARRTLLLVPSIVAVLVAGCGSGGEEASPEGGAASADAGATLEVAATDQLAFEPVDLAAVGPEVTIELACGPSVGHNLTIEADDTEVVACEAGETATGSTSLDAGDYEVYCSIAGHREAGMEATLTVSS